MTLLTVGHSNRTLEHFLAILETHGVRRIVDVRRFPHSRRHPHFSGEALARALDERGIGYAHRPELGGRRSPRRDSTNTALTSASFRGYADYMQTPPFAAALETLLQEGREPGTALMCAEADPAHCHRGMIADALVARGARVVHILSLTDTKEHALARGARVDASGRVAYPGAPSLW
jgi:uncharacterized protein (DUF488 family)